MKNIKHIFILFLFAGLSATNISCDDDEIIETDRVTQLLSTGGTWTMQSVNVTGTDQTALYDGLQLSFTESTYTSLNGGVVWPAAGTWQFTDETAKTIKRNDDVLITVNEVEEKKLVLAFTWNKTTLGSGRTTSIAGLHTFTFTRP